MPRELRPAGHEVRVRDLGRIAYAEAFALQKRLQAEVIEARATDPDGLGRPMHLLLLEHDPPVITVSRRKGARDHLVASESDLAARGVEVAETDRGGDVTVHGPGQLVAYPIIDLNAFGLRLHGWMRLLEQAVIDVLAGHGLAGERDDAATGVWLHRARSDGGAKVCALGVRVARWVTMHGLALNVRTDPALFSLIVPCGLAGRPVTTLEAELGSEACPSMDAVKGALARALEARLAEAAVSRAGSA